MSWIRYTWSLGGLVDANRVLIACLASFSAFFPSLPLVINGRMGLLRCRHTRRLRAAQQNTGEKTQIVECEHSNLVLPRKRKGKELYSSV